MKRELDVKCADGVPYPEIIAWLDRVSPGHGLGNYNLSRHTTGHITVQTQPRTNRKEPPVRFTRSGDGQARMDSRLYETPQVLDQAESSTRKDTDRRKATDIAGEMNISVQRLTEEIENLRKTPSGDWSPGMHKSFADYHEKLLKYLVAIGALKTVSGETQLDYEKFVKEMGIINESRNNSDGEEKAETEAKTDDTSQNSKPGGTSGVASRNDSGDGSSSGDDGPKENPS